MSQGTIIVGAVVLSFFVFITAKGQLPQYLGLLL